MRAIRLAVTALALASLLAGGASALPADHHVTLEADDGDSCLEQEALDCFRVTNGSLEGIARNDTVHVTVENAGDNPHNAYVTQRANADEDTRDTSGDDAINGTDTADPGDSVEMLFDVPADADGLYLWCDVGTHEAAGMYLTADVAEAPEDSNGTDGNGTGDGGDGTDGASDGGIAGVPAPGALAAVAAGLAAARARRA